MVSQMTLCANFLQTVAAQCWLNTLKNTILDTNMCVVSKNLPAQLKVLRQD